MLLNWILYVVIMGIMTVCASVFTERFFVVLIVFGLMVPFVSLFVVLLYRKRFLAALHADTEVCRSGEEFRYHVSITNHGRIACGNATVEVTNEDLLFRESEAMEANTAIAGHSKSRCDMAMPVSHCGRLQLTLRDVRLYGPFGLFYTHAKIENAVTVFDVYPDDVEMTVSPAKENPFAYIAEEEYSATRPGDDPSELFGVREYRPGDKQNRIHWNLTAARDELIVKELGLPVDTATVFLVDCCELPHRNGERMYDALMMTLSAVARAMIAKRRIFYLAWLRQSDSLGTRSGKEKGADASVSGSTGAWRNRIESEEDFLFALTQIFEIQPTGKTESVTVQYANRFAKERYRNILYVTTDLTQTAAEGLARMRFDSHVTVYEIVPGDNPGKIYLRKDGIRVQPVRIGHVREDLNREDAE